MTPQNFSATGKACGKFILIGEHFVVHSDAPAIALPLKELWCEVFVQPHDVPSYSAKYVGVKRMNEDETATKALMDRAARAAMDALRMSLASQPLRVESKANFPVSRGFGSSAAFSVALARALFELRTKLTSNWELTDPHTELLKTASRVERIFHGNPSGVDTAVIAESCPIYFERTNDDTSIVTKLSNRAADFILVDAGMRDPSSSLVEKITSVRMHDQNRWQDLAARTRAAAKVMQSALDSPSGINDIAAAVNESQKVLSELGLSSPQIDEIISAGISCGAVAGKVSGAGSGGATLLACKPGTTDSVLARLADKSFPIVAVSKADQS